MTTESLANVLAKLQEADTLVGGVVRECSTTADANAVAALAKARSLIKDVGFTIACDVVIGAVGASTDGK